MQRAAIYRTGVEEEARKAFRASLRELLDGLSVGYEKEVHEDLHLSCICRVADELSECHGTALRGGRFRIGPAQKALNLFLKYQWCAGWIATPPHCPFDAIVINRLPMQPLLRWTELDDIRDYEKLVAAARTAAGAMSLAEWELRLYNAETIRVRAAS